MQKIRQSISKIKDKKQISSSETETNHLMTDAAIHFWMKEQKLVKLLCHLIHFSLCIKKNINRIMKKKIKTEGIYFLRLI